MGIEPTPSGFIGSDLRMPHDNNLGETTTTLAYDNANDNERPKLFSFQIKWLQ